MLKTVSTQLALASDTLPEVLAKGNTTGGTDLAVSTGDDITFADNSKAIFGAGSDLSIYSDGATGQVTGDVDVTGAAMFSGNSSSRNTIVSKFTIDGGSVVANPYQNYGFGVDFIGRDYGDAIRNYAGIYSVMEANSSSAGGGDAGFKSGLTFYTNGGGASGTNPVENMRIDADGNLSLASGNVVLASGSGIDFSATAGTGTSELLDDYEEGTWTVTSIGGVTFTGSPTYTGIYTKIGRMVYVNLRIQATDIASVSGYINGGLPFVSANYITNVSIANTSNNADLGIGLIALSGGNTIVYLPTFSGVADVTFSGFYYV
jgi:hypothetical protein